MTEPTEHIGQGASRYRVVRRLGAGAMGQVFETDQVSLNRRVAVKMMNPRHFADAESRGRFVAEARIMARLSHPNVVTLFDADVQGDSPYIVMEFVRGPTLFDVLKERGKLPLDEALQISRGILAGLGYLHECCVFHRDLKAENILMQDGKVPRLADFGLARAEGSSRLTAEGYTVGTPIYMSPEQMGGAPGSAKSDLYSFGILFCRMVAGRFPVQAPTAAEMLPEKLSFDRAKLKGRLPGVPGPIVELVSRLLAPDPAGRPESAQEVLAALRAIGSPSGKMAARPAQAPAAAKKPRRLRWVLPVVVVAVALLSGALLFSRPTPMASDERYAPRGLKVTARPGACLVSWESALPYVSAVHAFGERHATAGPRTQHEVLVRGVPWASPDSGSVLMADGSKSPPFALAALPLTVQPRVTLLPARLKLELDLPRAQGLTLEVVCSDGQRRKVDVPPAKELRADVDLLHPDHPHQVLPKPTGIGVLEDRFDAILVPSVGQAVFELEYAVGKCNLHQTMQQVVMRSHRGQPRQVLQARLEELLGLSRWRRRASEHGELYRHAVSAGGYENSAGATTVEWLQMISLVDQAAIFLGVPFDSGARALLGDRWACTIGPPPPGGKSAEVRHQGRGVGLMTEQMTALQKHTTGAETPAQVVAEFDLPDTRTARAAYISLEVENGRPDAWFTVEQLLVDPRPERQLHLFYRSPEPTRTPVWITQSLDPRWLLPGKNRLAVRFHPLPGTLATGAWLRAIRVTIM